MNAISKDFIILIKHGHVVRDIADYQDHTHIMPPPLGVREDIYIYWGFMSPKCVYIWLSNWPYGYLAIWTDICICARLCLCDISYSFLPMAFKFSDMVTLGKTLN